MKKENSRQEIYDCTIILVSIERNNISIYNNNNCNHFDNGICNCKNDEGNNGSI